MWAFRGALFLGLCGFQAACASQRGFVSDAPLAPAAVPKPVAPEPAVAGQAWFDAVAENHYATVKTMLDEGHAVNTSQRVTELTALHFAAGGGAGETLVLLLCRGAQVDARDTVDMTALHHACELGQAAIAGVLLAHGADVNAVGGVHGYAPLHLAAQNDHADLGETLLAHGADLNAREGHGATALHFAVLHGRTAAAERLIDRGADMADVTTRDGWGLLHLAALRGHVDCALMLLDRGAAVGVQDHEGMTPLDRAVHSQQTKMVNLLRDAEAAE